VESVRIIVGLFLMAFVGWLLGSDPDYRPDSLNLWLVVSVALGCLAILGAWRSAVPLGSTRGPLVLLVLALSVLAIILWDSADWVRRNSVILVGLAAVAIGLSGRNNGTREYYRPLVAVAWVPAPQAWVGTLPAITKASVALGTARLDLTEAQLAGATDLNIILVLGRLELHLPPDWRLELWPQGGLGVKVEGEITRGEEGPPLNLRVLGVGGVLALRRVA
jgi:hypothetical protein